MLKKDLKFYKLPLATIFIAFIFSFSACDDGNIITTTFDFDENTNLSLCQQGDINVLYFIDQETNEAISFQFSDDDFDGTFTQIDESTVEFSYDINATNRVVYRRLSGSINANDYYCQEVPPSSPQVREEYISTNGGTATLQIRVFEQDDDDGVPAELEDINDNGELFDDDTDGDGIPNFLDVDDDNDNVLTRLEELEEEDENGNIIPGVYVDTDLDGVFDYLDNDDDGDGVLTRNEDINVCLDPENPLLNPDNDTNADGLPNYLNDQIAETVTTNLDNLVKDNEVTRSFFTQVVFNDITFNNVNSNESLTFTSFIMGRYTINNVEQVLEFTDEALIKESDAGDFCQ